MSWSPSPLNGPCGRDLALRRIFRHPHHNLPFFAGLLAPLHTHRGGAGLRGLSAELSYRSAWSRRASATPPESGSDRRSAIAGPIRVIYRRLVHPSRRAARHLARKILACGCPAPLDVDRQYADRLRCTRRRPGDVDVLIDTASTGVPRCRIVVKYSRWCLISSVFPLARVQLHDEVAPRSTSTGFLRAHGSAWPGVHQQCPSDTL